MNKDYTHIAMVIDRSGSMSSCWSDVKGGYAEIIKTNKETPGKCTFTVAAFDTEYDLLEDFTDIQSVNEELSVNPRGGTALLDAVGKTIVSVGEKLAKLDEKERPEKVILFINTDGYENASKEFTKDAVKKLIDEHSNVWKWQIQFLGADLQSVNEARSWGIDSCNTSTYCTTNSLDTFNLVGEKWATMRSAKSVDEYKKAAAFSEEDKVIMNSLEIIP